MKRKIEEEKSKKAVKGIDKKLKTAQEKQLKFAIIMMVVVIAAFLISYYASRWIISQAGKFEYAGIDFSKAQTGYMASFPLEDAFGNKAEPLRIIFWEDPRKTERIAINGSIRLKKTVAIGVEAQFVENCIDSIQAGTTLAAFLTKLGITAFAADTNYTEAKMLNRTYVDCDNPQGYSVIISRIANESRIIQKGDCYILEAGNNCEIMNVSEKFLIGLYANSKGIKV